MAHSFITNRDRLLSDIITGIFRVLESFSDDYVNAGLPRSETVKN